MPQVSVILPVYNGERYLREAIDSIVAQTFSDWELIVVNDASTDGTATLLAAYTDPRIRVLHNEKNRRISDTLNRGIAAATGVYLARMDADDISLPTRLEKQVAFLEKHPAVAVVGCDVELFGESVPTRPFPVSHTAAALRDDALFNAPLAHPSVMMRRSLFAEEGFAYESAFNGMEDYRLFWKISRKHELGAVAECLFRYRLHPAQITQNPKPELREKQRLFRLDQLSDLAVDCTEAEAEAFRYALCGEYFRFDYPDVFSVFSKVLRSAAGTAGVRRILTGKAIEIVKASLVPKAEADALLNALPADRNLVFRYRFRRFLRPLYDAQEQRKTARRTAPARARLKHTDFTIISNNCWAGFVYKKFGLPYDTPTIGLGIYGADYIKFCAHLFDYLALPLRFIEFEESKYYDSLHSYFKPYPVARLGDIELHFAHYHSRQEAEQKWHRRVARIHKDRIIYKISHRDLFSDEDIQNFLDCHFPHTLCFDETAGDGKIAIPGLSQVVGDETSLISRHFDVTDYLNSL